MNKKQSEDGVEWGGGRNARSRFLVRKSAHMLPTSLQILHFSDN